ncbi:hypothetical protein N7534_002400 [Penicillium rubens]|nr:hypothetical protein N7534_002400 [Penicillium rubens]
MADLVRLAVGMDLETQQASAKAGGWGVEVVRLGYIQPPFHVLSAQGPYLKMQEWQSLCLVCWRDRCGAQSGKQARLDGTDVLMSGKNQQASAKAGEIPSQNLSNYLWRVTLVRSTSSPCIVRSGTSPKYSVCWCGCMHTDVCCIGNPLASAFKWATSWQVTVSQLVVWICLVKSNKRQQKLVRSHRRTYLTTYGG